MNNRSMLKHIKLEASSNVIFFDRMMQANATIQAQDQAVLDYIKIRGSNLDFRNKLKATLKEFKSRRGPKPDGLHPIAFFELIKAIKRSYQLRSISAALETFCALHDLPPEKATSLEDKYRRGREQSATKRASPRPI